MNDTRFDELYRIHQLTGAISVGCEDESGMEILFSDVPE